MLDARRASTRIDIFRVEDEKLASVTAVVEDDLSRLTQLGLAPTDEGAVG